MGSTVRRSGPSIAFQLDSVSHSDIRYWSFLLSELSDSMHMDVSVR